MAPAFEITSAPDPKDIDQIGEALSAFNDADAEPANMIVLAVLVREGGKIIAGLSGNTAWGWLYVQRLWVSETARGQGLAGKMLAKAEAEAVRRGCHSAYIDTFNPVALKTYEGAGYVPFGTLENFPGERSRTFLKKRLQP